MGLNVRNMTSGADFLPGLELAHGFYADLVKPLLAQRFPAMPYTAALIGAGSDVLGFDTPLSTDHDWGPRVMLFLRPTDYEARREEIHAYLGHNLPPAYCGYDTNFAGAANGVQYMAPAQDWQPGRFINHRVELFTLIGFFRSYLNLAIAEPLRTADWLSLPAQKLRSIAAGGVFRDDLALARIRARLARYPRDVWLYILGCTWTRIAQEEHLMGRAGAAGDEPGSALIAARLVRDIMRIGFLLERQYPPYPKWLGTAFSKLTCASALQPLLEAVLHARTWQARQTALAAAYEALVQVQRNAGLADNTAGKVRHFWDRPFLVIYGGEIAQAIFAQIADPNLAALARQRPIGNIDLVSDNTDLLENASLRPHICALYEL